MCLTCIIKDHIGGLISVLSRFSKEQGATSEKGTFMRKCWLKKGTLMRRASIAIVNMVST